MHNEIEEVVVVGDVVIDGHLAARTRVFYK